MNDKYHLSRLPGVPIPSGQSLFLPAAVCILLVAGSVFGRGLDNLFVSDDWAFLYGAAQVKSVSDLAALLSFNTLNFARPVQGLVILGLYRVFSLVSVPYHWLSWSLHLLNAALLIALVQQVARRMVRLSTIVARGGALLSALLFLLNWHHHEAIFWVSSLTEPLVGFLRLIILVAATRWLRGPRLWRTGYALSLGCLGLALLTKESAIGIPFELLGMAFLFWWTGSGARRLGWNLLALVPFGAGVAIWLGVYLTSTGAAVGVTVRLSGLQVLQASPLEWVWRFMQYIDNHYVGGNLLLSRNVWLVTLQAAALLVLSLLAIRRRQVGWLLTLAWMLVAVAPYVAVVPQEVTQMRLPVFEVGVFGDRYLYYSSAGAGLFLMASLSWVGQAIESWRRPLWHWAWRAGCAVLLVLLVGYNTGRLIQDEADWDLAGRIGATIVRKAAASMSSQIGILCLANLPDSYRGKYIFRNGVGGAFYFAVAAGELSPGVGLRVLADANPIQPPPECTSLWIYVASQAVETPY